MASKTNHWGIFERRVFSVLFLVILSIAVARAQEPLVSKAESCSSLIKTANSFAHYQSELLLAQARFNLHCDSTPRFHAYDESTCNELKVKIAVMKKALSVCEPIVTDNQAPVPIRFICDSYDGHLYLSCFDSSSNKVE